MIHHLSARWVIHKTDRVMGSSWAYFLEVIIRSYYQRGALLRVARQAVGGGRRAAGARMQPTATRGPDVGFAGDNMHWHR